MAENVEIKGLGFADALKAVASIISDLKATPQGQERKNIKLAKRKLKQFKKELEKDGWEDWEKQIYNDLIKAYAEQLKNLMSK